MLRFISQLLRFIEALLITVDNTSMNPKYSIKIFYGLLNSFLSNKRRVANKRRVWKKMPILKCKKFYCWVVYFLTNSIVLSRSFTNSRFTLYQNWSKIRHTVSFSYLVLPLKTLSNILKTRSGKQPSKIGLNLICLNMKV